MKSRNTHIINRQELQVEMENPADVFEFRNRLGEVMYDWILPQMENLFNEFSANEKMYRIDKLEIDAGTIASENWERDLTNKTITELRQALILQDPLWTSGETQSRDAKAGNEWAAKPKENENGSSVAKFEDIYLYYLQKGTLPWYAPAGYRIKDYFTTWLQTEPQNFLQSFIENADDTQLVRLLFFANDMQLLQIVKLLLHDKQPVFWIDFNETSKRLTRQLITVLQGNIAEAKKAVYLPLLHFFSSKSNYKEITDYYTRQLSSYLIRNNLADVTNDLTRFTKQDKSDIIDTIVQLRSAKSKEHSGEDAAMNKEAGEMFSSKKEKEQQEKEQNGPEINFIENGGLVILHPFLTGLFAEVKLTKDNKWANDFATMKAIVLTNYLVYGNDEYEDHQLQLNKILCGFPETEPIPGGIFITDKEKEEADSLLSQVITMWKKNNVQVNDTVEGFQQSFVQRSAKLESKEKGWYLRVEQKPYDLVMSWLPWGISMIKTPWTAGMLKVEWA